MASSTTVLAVKTPTLTHKQRVRVCVCVWLQLREADRKRIMAPVWTHVWGKVFGLI